MISDKNVGVNLIRNVFFALCKSVDTPFSLHLWMLFKHHEHDQLVRMVICEENYTDASVFAADYLCLSYLTKYKGLALDIDLKAVALGAFNGAELRCKEQNQSFQAHSLKGFSPFVEAVIHTARRKIDYVLGDLRPFRCFEDCMWGPGVTASIKGRSCTMANKIGEMPIRVSRSALPYLECVLQTDIHWAQALGLPVEGPFTPLPPLFKLADYCRVTTVPKNAKTDRTIAVEPTGNMFLQKGIGNFIRKRLRIVGIDLNDQTKNRNLARIGSLYGDLATLDLTAASDTISKGLIQVLLPEAWYDLLNRIRSTHYLLDKQVSKFHKFSTMGNGFTFELESLVFWALTQSISDLYSEATDKTVSVYGDDIICPCDIAEKTVSIFSELGLVINQAKSFWSGPFRESCGGHYFNGCDVTPIYQKEIPNVLEEVYRLANRIRRLAFSMGSGRCCHSGLRPAWLAASQLMVPRHFVPLDSESDEGLALDFQELGSHLLPKGYGGYTLPVYRFSSRSSSDGGRPGLALWFRLRKNVSVETDVHAVRRRGRFVSRRSYFTSTLHAPWL